MKPIKFEPYKWCDKNGDRKELVSHKYGLVLQLTYGTEAAHCLPDQKVLAACTAAEARALSAKINEWADAKEASERVTIGDLSIGDAFRLEYDASTWIVTGTEDNASYYLAVCIVFGGGDSYAPGADGRFIFSCPVIKMRATFEEVKP